MLHTFVAPLQERPGVLTRAASLFLLFPMQAAFTQTVPIRIRVLDGRTGKPYTHASIIVWDDTLLAPGHAAAVLPSTTTDDQGISVVQTSPSARISIHVTAEVGSCLPKSRAHEPLSVTRVADILSSGVLQRNICGKPHVEPHPGELVVFQRPLHWYERLSN